jgi:hypothetical protein
LVEEPKGAISPAGQGRQGAGVEDCGEYVPARPADSEAGGGTRNSSGSSRGCNSSRGSRGARAMKRETG